MYLANKNKLQSCISREIKIFPGAIKYIKRQHPKDLKKYFDRIHKIISTPDFVGQNPNEPNSVELVKRFEDNVLVAIKSDPFRIHLPFTGALVKITVISK